MQQRYIWMTIAALFCLTTGADGQQRPAPVSQQERAQTPPNAPQRPPREPGQLRGPNIDAPVGPIRGACPDPAAFDVTTGVTAMQRETTLVSSIGDFELHPSQIENRVRAFEFAAIQAGAGQALCYYSIENSYLAAILISRGTDCQPDAANVWTSDSHGGLTCDDSRTTCRFTCD